MRTRWSLPLAALATIAVAAPAGAHGIDVDVIASGLDNPRHVAVSKDGDVYVAESGRGGNPATSRSCFNSAEGVACTGATGAVTKVSRGWRGWRQDRILRGLASFAPADGSSAIGPHGIYVDGHDLYVTNGGPTAPWRGDDDTQTVLRDPTLVSEEPVSRLYGTLLKFPKHGHPAARRRRVALRARREPGRGRRQPADRQQPGGRVRRRRARARGRRGREHRPEGRRPWVGSGS